jgi:hypothetical protein
MSQKVGLSTRELSSLSFVAKMSGMDTEGLAMSVRMLSKNMLDAASGGKQASKYFDLLKVSVQNSDKTLRSSMSVLEDLADRFADMPDGATKTALALSS